MIVWLAGSYRIMAALFGGWNERLAVFGLRAGRSDSCCGGTGKAKTTPRSRYVTGKIGVGSGVRNWRIKKGLTHDVK